MYWTVLESIARFRKDTNRKSIKIYVIFPTDQNHYRPPVYSVNGFASGHKKTCPPLTLSHMVGILFFGSVAKLLDIMACGDFSDSIGKQTTPTPKIAILLARPAIDRLERHYCSSVTIIQSVIQPSDIDIHRS